MRSYQDASAAGRTRNHATGWWRSLLRDGGQPPVQRWELTAGPVSALRQPSVSIVSDALTFVLRTAPGAASLGQLREVRRVLEPALAELAAVRRGPEDLRALEHEIAPMRDPTTPADEWARADVLFHTALARATHNPIFGIVLNSVQDLQVEARLLAVQLPETRANGLYHHEQILAAIREGNAGAARRAMLAHLREAETTQLRAATRMPEASPPAPRAQRRATR